MYQSIKRLVLPVFLLALTSFFQTGCKKKDVYPDQQLPKIAAIQPSSAIPGTEVFIKGTGLQNVNDVKFGTVSASSITVMADTMVKAIVPDAEAAMGELYVQVYYPEGKGYNASKFTILPKPRVPDATSLLPEIAYPGDLVTIKGINMDVVTEVKFGSVAASSFTKTETKIEVNVPATAAGGLQLITLGAASGSDTISFTVNLAPVITSFSPTRAKEGEEITVSGVRFTGATAVKLGAASSSYTVVNDNTLKFTVPAGAATAKITVTTPNGSGTSGDNLAIDVAGFKFVVYDDAVQGLDVWGGWGGSKDVDNTSPVKSGAKSIKLSYAGGWGSPLQLGGRTIDISTYSTFKLSIYGAPGTTGKKIKIVFNGSGGKELVLLDEGKWNDYVIPLADITNASSVTEMWLQEFTGTDYIIYVDDMGFN
ncbi:MAG: hypothetical protein RL172_1421 [Bacteroidota bacterium]|jgi:hypothetical protein